VGKTLVKPSLFRLIPCENEQRQTVIKYLGSKRTLLGVLGAIAQASEAKTAVDLFTGTTRVAAEFKRNGLFVTASDSATYSDLLAKCYLEIDATKVDLASIQEKIDYLARLPGQRGYFTEHFCEDARFFQAKNGMRIDAIRDELEENFRDDKDFPILLTALMLAADRVDSTTGQQMAYLKNWSHRSGNDLELKVPELISGTGKSILGLAENVVKELPEVDLFYMDPPYNQHRYFTNYHIWETLVRWDKPPAYGVAMKRLDSRATVNHSVFNKRRKMPGAFKDVILNAKTKTLVVSYNNESWVEPIDIAEAMLAAGHESVALLEFDYKRYIGSQIGIYNKSGAKVGEVGERLNKELIFIAGETSRVEAIEEVVAGRGIEPRT
jgi:adenine-specific DNA-methyltransferase